MTVTKLSGYVLSPSSWYGRCDSTDAKLWCVRPNWSTWESFHVTIIQRPVTSSHQTAVKVRLHPSESRAEPQPPGSVVPDFQPPVFAHQLSSRPGRASGSSQNTRGCGLQQRQQVFNTVNHRLRPALFAGSAGFHVGVRRPRVKHQKLWCWLWLDVLCTVALQDKAHTRVEDAEGTTLQMLQIPRTSRGFSDEQQHHRSEDFWRHIRRHNKEKTTCGDMKNRAEAVETSSWLWSRNQNRF